jgi:hypothetical protein
MSLLDKYKLLKIYSDIPNEINIPYTDVITQKSMDFLGIRECKIALIRWENQIEIGAALALRKRVLTVHVLGAAQKVNDTNFKNPYLLIFDNWEDAIECIPTVVTYLP